ncbi:MAG TPA: hypothetical protein VHE61_09415 [Opitutaceae bacterium]|nr:hypothetical protein [Opitutaceae bacterium]
MFARALFFALAVMSAAAGARAEPAGDYARVEVAPTKTSIYVGTVAMTMPTFVRRGNTYVAPYAARVFPFFFYSEKGSLTVDVTDAQLAGLAAGRPLDFTGHAVRSDGVERRVTGRATPHDPKSGTLKVRVYVSRRIDLVFNTTYRFEAEPTAAR